MIESFPKMAPFQKKQLIVKKENPGSNLLDASALTTLVHLKKIEKKTAMKWKLLLKMAHLKLMEILRD